MTLISEQIENIERYRSFIVFEPASVRISDQDILFIGKDVRPAFDKTFDYVIQNEDDMKMKILYHQMQKLSNMLDLIEDFDNIIITKFFDRIWRRYSYVTHLGESFIELNTFLNLFPEYNDKFETVVANRTDTEVEFVDEDEDDDEDDDQDKNDDEDDDQDKNDDKESLVENHLDDSAS